MNDHVTKPIDPDLLFCTLLKWIDPARLEGRPAPQGLQPAVQAQAPGHERASSAALPAVPGIDWRLALDKVDGQHRRLEKRAGSFVREYAAAPRILRDALAAGDHACLQGLAHNLKSSAAYVGAFELAGAASRLEQDLRAGQLERVGIQVPALVAAAESVLAGLAQLAAATLPKPSDPGALAAVIARLEGHLRADDARAEDALTQLEGLLAASVDPKLYDAALDDVRRAVADIEYAAALAPLSALAAQLDLCHSLSLESSR
jgi:two-component system sensor histidine kinase/response regulator